MYPTRGAAAGLGLAVVVALGVALPLLRPDPAVAGQLALLACLVLVAVHRWATARRDRLVAARLRRSEAWFRSVVRSHTDAVLVLDGRARVVWAAPPVLALLDPALGSVLGRPVADLVHADDAAELGDWLAHPPTGAPGGLRVLRLPRADGSWHHLEATTTDLRDDPEVHAVVLHCRDVTDRVDREAQLTVLAYTDPTTGLPNRGALLDLLAGALAEVGRDGAARTSDATLLLLEVAGLAECTRALGRTAVDAAIAEVGHRLRAVVRAEDVVARFSGDVFAVLAHGTVGEGDLVAARCLAVIDQPITTELGLLDLTADAGLVVLTPGQTLAELLQLADLAVTAAVTAGPGVVRSCSSALLAARDREEMLRRDLLGARARGELSLVFQPIVSLAEQRITGAQALLRWTHPVLGDIPPEEFMPVAERAGVLADLEKWVLAEACTAASTVSDADGPLRIGVTVSAAHVASGALVGHVSAALAGSGLAPERLIVDVSADPATADGGQLSTEFAALRLMGVRVALDGFSAETSVLSHLTRLPLDVLKIDRSFLVRIDRDARTRVLCESVIRVAEAVGFDVVAVGVEAPSELAVLRRLGCGFAQGRLLARPMSLPALQTLVAERAGQLWPGLVGQS